MHTSREIGTHLLEERKKERRSAHFLFVIFACAVNRRWALALLRHTLTFVFVDVSGGAPVCVAHHS